MSLKQHVINYMALNKISLEDFSIEANLDLEGLTEIFNKEVWDKYNERLFCEELGPDFAQYLSQFEAK